MLSTQQIDTILETVKRIANPSELFLFGSYAKGTATESSDVDILVIKPKLQNRRKEETQILRQLLSPNYSIDLLLLSQSQFERKKKEGWRLFDEIEATARRIPC